MPRVAVDCRHTSQLGNTCSPSSHAEDNDDKRLERERPGQGKRAQMEMELLHCHASLNAVSSPQQPPSPFKAEGLLPSQPQASLRRHQVVSAAVGDGPFVPCRSAHCFLAAARTSASNGARMPLPVSAEHSKYGISSESAYS
jgi:hypothetical protein